MYKESLNKIFSAVVIVTIPALTHVMDAMLNELDEFPQVFYRVKMNIREPLPICATLTGVCFRRSTLDEMVAELSND